MTVEGVAFEDFVASRYGALLRTAFLLTGDYQHAEDLLQTALTSVYLRWSRLRDKGAAEAYVRKTLATTYTSWWRRRSWREHPQADLPERSASADVTSGSDARNDMWVHLRTLPRQQRAVIVLRFYDDRSVEETAALLGIGAGSVKSYTSRALSALRIQIDGSQAPLIATSPATAGEH
jgi:RNA polymerase sigma-70 factor (ECF subfamily)